MKPGSFASGMGITAEDEMQASPAVAALDRAEWERTVARVAWYSRTDRRLVH